MGEVALGIHAADALAGTVGIIGRDGFDGFPLVLCRELVPRTLGGDAVPLQGVGVPELLKIGCFVHDVSGCAPRGGVGRKDSEWQVVVLLAFGSVHVRSTFHRLLLGFDGSHVAEERNGFPLLFRELLIDLRRDVPSQIMRVAVLGVLVLIGGDVEITASLSEEDLGVVVDGDADAAFGRCLPREVAQESVFQLL